MKKVVVESMENSNEKVRNNLYKYSNINFVIQVFYYPLVRVV